MGVHSKLSTPSWPPRGLLAALHGYEATLSMSALRSVSKDGLKDVEFDDLRERSAFTNGDVSDLSRPQVIEMQKNIRKS